MLLGLSRLRVFSATRAPRSASSASYTTPMPPSPMKRTIFSRPPASIKPAGHGAVERRCFGSSPACLETDWDAATCLVAGSVCSAAQSSVSVAAFWPMERRHYASS